MPPASFNDFFITCVGASASFIGLLFVAISVVLSRGDSQLEFNDRRLAETAFMALANIFFVSLQAVMPAANIGYIAIIFGALGISSAFRIFSYRQGDKAVLWFVSSNLAYLFQIFYSIRLIIHPDDVGDIYALASLILILFGGALVRSWELTGIRGRR
jgi:hypothetical protein